MLNSPVLLLVPAQVFVEYPTDIGTNTGHGFVFSITNIYLLMCVPHYHPESAV